MDNHPLIPSNHLISKWEEDYFDNSENLDVLLIQAYQAGADAELNYCCDWVSIHQGTRISQELRSYRRPIKRISKKEEALLAIDTAVADGRISPVIADIVRIALEEQSND